MIGNSVTVILLNCKRKTLALMKIVLKHSNLKETKNSLHVTDFYTKLADKLEVNIHRQNDPNCILPAISILRLKCSRLETTLGPEVTSL